MKTILLLDDDPMIHEIVRSIVDLTKFNLKNAMNVEEARTYLQAEDINFVICDLFLNGDLGDELSNGFIREHVKVRWTPYCRLTSAPRLVPEDCVGLRIIDKRNVYNDTSLLIDLLKDI